ncbi:hypothetical protein C5469_14845 [Photorhabdus cinerea]|uniref:Uncharacterized protein n=1 Tax=Photorhabdus cinerea TaxID=471575 RepID=A0A7X5QFT8_9GAMM|nr:hypothetical protein [Photorhabdus cinerea]
MPCPLVYPPAETGFQLFFGPAMTITGFDDPQADNKEGQSETAKRAFPHPPPPVPCQSRASETVLTVLSPVTCPGQNEPPGAPACHRFSGTQTQKPPASAEGFPGM